jgi:hypothetical protein
MKTPKFPDKIRVYEVDGGTSEAFFCVGTCTDDCVSDLTLKGTMAYYQLVKIVSVKKEIDYKEEVIK